MRVRRWVQSVDDPASLDRAGFQLIPSSEGFWVWSRRPPRPLLDLAGRPTSFVLLAPPAVGKSEALTAVREREPDAVDIAPEGRTADGLEAALQAAMGSAAPVYLDALDQAVLYIPQLFRMLQRLMTSDAGRQTRWRLACRPAVWDAGLAGVLERELGLEQLRLTPLDRQAVCDLVEEQAAGQQRFVELLTERRLRGLPGTPGRLLTVARDWHETGRFPTSTRDTMELELHHLLIDHDQHRPSEISDDDRRRTTRRLAAFHLLSGASRFRSTGTASVGVTAVTSLPSVPDPDRPSHCFNPDLYRAALDGPLFVSASESTVTFAHQPHAEYLAATYLIDRDVGRVRLHQLLGLGPARVLPPSLAGLAAWIATLRPDLVDDLLETNALVLMQSAAELPTDAARRAVVAGLLDGAERGAHHPDWQVQLASLAHPELTNQLLAALERPGTPAELVWWVAKLAIGGGCRNLTDRLQVLAGDASLADYARTACIEAVGKLGTDEQHRGLRVLLELDPEDDRDDELLAATIQELYPDELSTVELLQALRPRRRKNLFGRYAKLLSQLGTMVPDHDLPATLAWLTTLANDNEDEFENLSRLVGELLKRAWNAGDAGGGSLVDMLAQLDDVPRWAIRSGHLELPWTAPELTARRRMLVVDVAARLESRDHAHALMDFRLIDNLDLLWLLDELPNLPEPARDVLARVVPWLTYGLSADLADHILRLEEDHPAHEHTRHLRGQCRLDSPDAVRGRRRADREHETGRHRVSPDQHRQRIQQALGAAEHDPSSWPQVVDALADPNDDRFDEALYADITARSGWSLLSEQESERVFVIGITFVAGHTPDPDSWRGQKTISGPAWIRDWAGVWLLTTLLRHDPDRLHAVSADTWRRLAPALVGAWDPGGGDSGGGLRGALLQQAPPEALPTLAAAALEQLDADIATGRGTISLHQLGVLTPLLGPQLVDRLLVNHPDDVTARELVTFLAEAAGQVPTVIEWLQTLSEAASSPVAPTARLHLAELAPRSALGTILEPETDENERRNLICRLAFPDLDDVQLAHFAKMLLERYPSEDGPYEAAVTQGDPMLTVENVRWRVLQLLAQRAQVDTLAALTQASHGQDRRTLSYLAGQAKLHHADQALSPVAPDVLIELLQRGDARLVRSDVDLLEILIEQLGRIQQHLHTQGHARFLWNEDKTSDTSSLKPENDISLWITSQLASTLSGALIDRELEVTPSRVGSGTRIDLTATAPTATHPAGIARVLIEAKRYDNTELLTALHDQLVNRYLLPESRTAGLYLVYWVDPALRPAKSRGRTRHPDLTEVRTTLEQQAQSIPATVTVRPVVLDVSPVWRTAGGSGNHSS